jgi:hypothetical protein
VLLTEATDGLHGIRRTSAFDHWKSTGNGCRPQNADSPNPDADTSAIQEIGYHPHDTVVTREALHNWMVCAWLGA